MCVLTNSHKFYRLGIASGVGLWGAGGEVKNFNIGICDGATSTARFSLLLTYKSNNVLRPNLHYPQPAERAHQSGNSLSLNGFLQAWVEKAMHLYVLSINISVNHSQSPF